MIALIVGLYGCRKNDGPAEHAGKQVDRTVEKAGQQIENVDDKIQDAAKGADEKQLSQSADLTCR